MLTRYGRFLNRPSILAQYINTYRLTYHRRESHFLSFGNLNDFLMVVRFFANFTRSSSNCLISRPALLYCKTPYLTIPHYIHQEKRGIMLLAWLFLLPVEDFPGWIYCFSQTYTNVLGQYEKAIKTIRKGTRWLQGRADQIIGNMILVICQLVSTSAKELEISSWIQMRITGSQLPGLK